MYTLHGRFQLRTSVKGGYPKYFAFEKHPQTRIFDKKIRKSSDIFGKIEKRFL